MNRLRRQPPSPPGPIPAAWDQAPRAWRFARYVTPNRVDRLLRLRSAAILPAAARARLHNLDLPPAEVELTLRQVRSLGQWPEAWVVTAQRFLGEARRHTLADQPLAATWAKQRAALCYHVATWLAYTDPAALRALRATAASLFAKTAPTLLPDARRLTAAWRAAQLPAYLRLPEGDGPFPLVVLLNGISTAKEELILWAESCLLRGQAVLALDTPGTGEAAELGPPQPDHDDITDGIIALAEAEPALDPRRVALVGVSFGGALAVQAAAADRRIAACVAVTPPFAAARWLHRASPLVVDQVVGFLGGWEVALDLADGFALARAAERLRCPLLVLGAGRDLVVPPAEAQLLAAAAGDLATLLWYPRCGHGLYEVLAAWTFDAAAWLDAVLTEPAVASSTRVDLAPVAAPESVPSAGPVEPVAPAPPPVDEPTAEVAPA